KIELAFDAGALGGPAMLEKGQTFGDGVMIPFVFDVEERAAGAAGDADFIHRIFRAAGGGDALLISAISHDWSEDTGRREWMVGARHASPSPRSVVHPRQLQIALALPLSGLAQGALFPPGQALHSVSGNFFENRIDPRLFGLFRGGALLGLADG